MNFETDSRGGGTARTEVYVNHTFTLDRESITCYKVRKFEYLSLCCTNACFLND